MTVIFKNLQLVFAHLMYKYLLGDCNVRGNNYE